MIVYLIHPQHGVHIAYSAQEVEMCKANGWTVREDKPAASAPAPASTATLRLPRRERQEREQ